MKRKRIKKLSPEAKKAIWSKPKSNAGAGWDSHKCGTDPLDFEEGTYTEDSDFPLDDPYETDDE